MQRPLTHWVFGFVSSIAMLTGILMTRPLTHWVSPGPKCSCLPVQIVWGQSIPVQIVSLASRPCQDRLFDSSTRPLGVFPCNGNHAVAVWHILSRLYAGQVCCVGHCAQRCVVACMFSRVSSSSPLCAFCVKIIGDCSRSLDPFDWGQPPPPRRGPSPVEDIPK